MCHTYHEVLYRLEMNTCNTSRYTTLDSCASPALLLVACWRT
jgi:hypothetical protein